eukprot:123309-Chlamydomonas_euryale.AAC.4
MRGGCVKLPPCMAYATCHMQHAYATKRRVVARKRRGLTNVTTSCCQVFGAKDKKLHSFENEFTIWNVRSQSSRRQHAQQHKARAPRQHAHKTKPESEAPGLAIVAARCIIHHDGCVPDDRQASAWRASSCCVGRLCRYTHETAMQRCPVAVPFVLRDTVPFVLRDTVPGVLRDTVRPRLRPFLCLASAWSEPGVALKGSGYGQPNIGTRQADEDMSLCITVGAAGHENLMACFARARISSAMC